MPFDIAGNTLNTAFDLNLNSNSQTLKDWVGLSDTNDFYRFNLSSRSSFSLSLDNLLADVNVRLIRDYNLNSVVDTGEIITGCYTTGTAAESIKTSLDSGTYFIQVYSVNGSTNYNLGVSAQPVNVAPTNLQFNLNNTNLKPTDALSINNGLVYDTNGATDISKVDFRIKKADGTFVEVKDVVSVTPASDKRWGSFNYELSLSSLNLASGNYSLWAVAYDKANLASNVVERAFSFTNNVAPNSLQFNLNNTNLKPTDALSINNGLVYDTNGATDISKVDFRIKKADGTFVEVKDVVSVTPASDKRWGSFNYELSLSSLNLASGNYSLWAVAYDKANLASNVVERAFSFTNNVAPNSLQFNLNNTNLKPTDALSINNGLVYNSNGATDISKVDFRIKKADGTFVEVIDVVSVTPSTTDNRWGSFNYNLSLSGLNLATGNYSLWAVAYDKANAASNVVERTFSFTNFTSKAITLGTQVDFNGDGKTDFIRQEKGAWATDAYGTGKVYLSNGDGTFRKLDLTDSDDMKGDLTNLIVGDYNGDGKTDFIRQEKGAWATDAYGTGKVYLSNGDGTFRKLDLTDSDDMKGDLTNLIVGDYNGDGKTDFIRQEKGHWATDAYGTGKVYLSNGDGTFRKLDLTDSDDMKGDLTNLIVGDYNGDGKTDFIRQEKGHWATDAYGTGKVYLSNGDGTFRKLDLTDSDDMKGDLTNLIVGDYNGDGKTDFIRQEKGHWATDAYGTGKVYLANGDGTFRKMDLTDSDDMKGDLTNLIVGDYNGDGKTDFIRQEKGHWATDAYGTGKVYLANGDGTFRKLDLTDSDDMKGDGVNIITNNNIVGREVDLVRQDVTPVQPQPPVVTPPSGLMATSDKLMQLRNGELNGKSFNVDNYAGAQCWDLVAYATGINSSSSYWLTTHWKAGANVMANGNVAVGTAIATFLGPNGAYDNPVKNANGKTTWIQHTAIFAGYGTENEVRGFYVWDQSWNQSTLDFDKRYVQKHFIRNNSSGTSDADNYYVIRT
ncbi:hypothetical protein NIES2100_06590 [Calothrix sp. NIES-2100]|uniref:BPSL0067 family protein n=1 Tax=Calothrix sp. NIES-2100 TaxID=1954172 RepID=UPI000B5EECAE|nr:hypothetical protein NIES2100_06590 [Calothrix sp. NIES-2100]